MASVVEGDGEGLEGSALESAGDLPEASTSVYKRKTNMDEIRRHELPKMPSVVIIREIYDSENANEIFEQQLEQALANATETIVIEPFKLGDETARWISVGNCLHKTAVLAGFGSIVAAFVWPDKPFIYVPATLLSGLCTGLYSISWQYDPCCKYQVETDARQLAQLSLQTLNSSSPVVLVRKDDTRRKFLHSAVTLACLTQTGLKLYYPFLSQYFSRASREVFPPHHQTSSTGRFLVAECVKYDQPSVPHSNSTSFFNVIGGGLNML